MAKTPVIRGKLAEEISRLREKKGFTLEMLAAQCGVTKSYIHQLEKGRRVFRCAAPFAVRLSKALGVPLTHWASMTSDGHLMKGVKK